MIVIVLQVFRDSLRSENKHTWNFTVDVRDSRKTLSEDVKVAKLIRFRQIRYGIEQDQGGASQSL